MNTDTMAVLLTLAPTPNQHFWGSFLELGVSAMFFGGVFGFLMQRARIIRFDKQINLLRLRDFTILKFMLSAVLVGAVAMQILAAIDFIELPWRPVVLARTIIGALLYGVGWAILGYCPGTQIGALGEGRYDAAAGIVGSLLATWLFIVVLNPLLIPIIMKRWNIGKYPLDVMLHVSPWVVIAVLFACCIPLFIWLERKRL